MLSEKERNRIRKIQSDSESAVRDVSEYQENETFEQFIERKFSHYYGKSISEIEKELNVDVDQSKSMAYNVCRHILGVKAKRIAEFEKADVQIKTIRLEPNGNLKESMSFPNIDYKGIVKEGEWESSALYEMFTKRFLFVIFRKSALKNDKNVVLERIAFWTMPVQDLQYAKILWADTARKVTLGNYEHFMKAADNPVCHIRPKAQNAADTTEGAQGYQVKKMCYWLNRTYVLKLLKSVLNK